MTPEQLIRRDTAKHFKNVHKALLIHTYDQEDKEAEKSERRYKQAKTAFILAIIVGCLFIIRGCDSPAMANTVVTHPNIAGYSLNQWCKAIFMAEGGEATRYPYGILAKYKHTTPLQSCHNTVKHKYSNWVKEGRKGAFLAYLGAKYCPIGSNIDNGTCKNWPFNVQWWLKKR